MEKIYKTISLVKPNSLSNIVDSLAEGIRKIKCKHGRDEKKMSNMSN